MKDEKVFDSAKMVFQVYQKSVEGRLIPVTYNEPHDSDSIKFSAYYDSPEEVVTEIRNLLSKGCYGFPDELVLVQVIHLNTHWDFEEEKP